MKLEVITIPVSDLDHAKEFYGSLGWRLDADFKDGRERAVQFTPPGSPSSIHFGTKGEPGSAQGLFLIVSDIEAARDDLLRRGVEVSEVFHFAPHELRLVRGVQRPGRERLAAIGDHDAFPGAGGGRHDLRVGT